VDLMVQRERDGGLRIVRGRRGVDGRRRAIGLGLANAQREGVNGHRFLPSYGHRISPLADTLSPRGWPSVLPSALSMTSKWMGAPTSIDRISTQETRSQSAPV
jgi:hypothetical protein